MGAMTDRAWEQVGLAGDGDCPLLWESVPRLTMQLARTILDLRARVEALEDELDEAKEMLGGYLDGRQQGTGPTTPGTTPTDRMA